MKLFQLHRALFYELFGKLQSWSRLLNATLSKQKRGTERTTIMMMMMLPLLLLMKVVIMITTMSTLNCTQCVIMVITEVASWSSQASSRFFIEKQISNTSRGDSTRTAKRLVVISWKLNVMVRSQLYTLFPAITFIFLSSEHTLSTEILFCSIQTYLYIS